MSELKNVQPIQNPSTPKIEDLQAQINKLKLPDVRVVFLKEKPEDEDEEINIEGMTLDKRTVAAVMKFIKDCSSRMNTFQTSCTELRQRHESLITAQDVQQDFLNRVTALEAFNCESKKDIDLLKKINEKEILA